MNLLNVIPGYPGQAAEEVLASLSADAIIATNSVSQSLAGVADALALQGVDPMILIDLRASIRTLPIGGDTLEGLLLTGGGSAGGVDFSLASVRYQIAANQQHSVTTPEQQAILAGMLLIGIQEGQEWQRVGLDALPTLEEIQAAIDTAANQQAKTTLMNDIVNPWLVDDSKTVADLATALGVDQ